MGTDFGLGEVGLDLGLVRERNLWWVMVLKEAMARRGF